MKRAASIAFLSLAAAVCAGQETVLRSKSELVLVPVSVTDKNGHAVRDLSEEDLVLYDNNVPRRVQFEDVTIPISLVIVVETKPESQIILDKLRKATGVIGPMITGSGGEAAVVAFGSEIRVVQPFSANEDDVANAIKRLDAKGSGTAIAQAALTGLQLLTDRPVGRRRVLLLLSEKHDFLSAKTIATAAELAETHNITVYSVAFSPSRAAWTNKVPVYCHPPQPANKCKACARTCGNCGNQCDRVDGKPQVFVPVQSSATMNLGALIREAQKMNQVNVGEFLAMKTGGEQTSFTTGNGLDAVLQRISQDLHGQYLLSFTPQGASPGEFRQLRVEVKNRKDLIVRARPGYAVGVTPRESKAGQSENTSTPQTPSRE